jgi:6-phosphogluconolactonase (cycloisomerase 2 family)
MVAGDKGNFVLAYSRGADGSLNQQGIFATGGTGAPIFGSHRALMLSFGGKWLMAANTGSNDVSVFRVHDNGLELRSRTTAGAGPVSLALYDKVLYVAGYTSHDLNAFTLSDTGVLTPLENSNRPLAGQFSSAIDIQFTPDGNMLTVTDMVNRLVEMYPIDARGLAGTPVALTSVVPGPAGFSYGPSKTLYVAENGMGLPGTGTISTYQYEGGGMLRLVDSSLTAGRTSTSTLKTVISGYVYAVNNGDGSISSFKVREDGGLSVLSASEALPCTGAQDMAASRDHQFLYVLSPSAVGICSYRIQPDGHLVYLPFNNPLPYALIQGIAAR